MSVGHTCNVVLGGLENMSWLSFYKVLQHTANHIDILS